MLDGDFGAPDRFGIVGESPLIWALREQISFLARREGQAVFAQVLAKALIVVGIDGNSGETLVSNGHGHPQGLR